MGFKLSARSQSKLIGVSEPLVEIVNRALEISEADFAVIEGLRSIEKQKENIRNGVSQTMKSKHLTGQAIDILPSSIKPCMKWELHHFHPVLDAFYRASEEKGIPLRFGINWKTDPSLPIETKFIDAPHIELV